ncbi:MAG: isopeptide-forming domain-containing fimbrial protein, partial [bacterium]
VDPGDVLRYRITVYNSGAADATAVRLRDDVPPETTYVADSLTLDGLPVGQPDGGVSPLVQGIAISSSELVPPLPPSGGGRIRAGENAVVTFALRVNDGVPGGTIIRNQALVESAELPGLRTDGDGDPATGPEPTLVVVGAGQQLAISKEVTVVGGGPALAGSELEYLVRVQNIGSIPASDVVLTDDLDQPVAGQLAYVAGSATLNGAPDGVSVAGSVLTADASSLPGPLAPGESLLLRFRAVLAADLEIGTTVVNTATVQWGMPPQTASASVSIDVGGTPGIGALNGAAWHDADHDRERGAGEQPLEGWWVELLRNGRLVQSVRTDASGGYRLTGIAPNDGTGDTYQLRFRAPGAGPRTASLGRTRSAFTDGLQSIEDIRVPAGSNLQDLDLPIDPNGSVYDAVLRTPVSGATLRLVEAGSGQPVSGSCFDDPEQQGQVTVANGFYKFDLNFADASCPSGGVYRIEVTAPGAGFVSGVSQIIPPSVDASGAAFSVPACPGSALDAIPLTAQHCEIQPSERAPAPSARARTGATRYHLLLAFDGSGPPGSSQVFNNHLPLDPALGGAVAITKTTPSLNVSRGDLVPYEITFDNGLPVPLEDLSLVDRYPAGFRYIEGSARIDGVPVEPTIQGRELVW